MIAHARGLAYTPEHMFDCVLGVDPGVASVGLAVLRRQGRDIEVSWTDHLRTSARDDEASRLSQIYRAVSEAISEHEPQALAVERLMWGKNVSSAMKVSRASGVILLAAHDSGIAVEEYAPLEVKMAVTGVGNAPKEQVRKVLRSAHRLEGVPDQPDAADAVAIAFCHLMQSRMRSIHKQAASR